MRLGILIGLIFSPLAATAAFLITYEEYRHHFPTPGPARRLALEMALVALVVFFLVPVVAATLILRWW